MVPSTALELHLHDQVFRLCLKYWMGVRMLEEVSIYPVCKVSTEEFGDHQVSCGGYGGTIHWQDHLRDALFSAAQSAALAPKTEVQAIIPGANSHLADVYLPC